MQKMDMVYIILLRFKECSFVESEGALSFE